LEVTSAEVSADRLTVRLGLRQIASCDMMQMPYGIESTDGVEAKDSIWNTIHVFP